MAIVTEPIYYSPAIDGMNYEPPTKDLGKDDFLKLLVTQLRFQNPIEPMQDQEFIAQLAQFSQLEQLENMSTALDTNSEIDYIMSQTIANTMATTLIGKTVVAEGADFELGDNGAEISFNLHAEAKTVLVNIYDESGSLVRTISMQDVPRGNNTITWDGKNDNGSKLAPGTYSFDVHATSVTGEEIAADKRVIGEVDSVKYEDGLAYLIVDGYRVNLGSIIEIVQGSDHTTRYQN